MLGVVRVFQKTYLLAGLGPSAPEQQRTIWRGVEGALHSPPGFPGPLLPNNVSSVTPPSLTPPPPFSNPACSQLLSLAGLSEPQHLLPTPHSWSRSNPWSSSARCSHTRPSLLAPCPPRLPRHLGVPLLGPVSSCPAVRSLPLQPPRQVLSSPPQLNQLPSLLSFLCVRARAELGRREEGEVALSVCLPPPLPGLLEVRLGRQERKGGCGELAARLRDTRAPWSPPCAGER